MMSTTRRAAVRPARVRVAAAVAALALAGAGSVLFAAPASAAVLPLVDSLTDDGTGYTLREAIADAESGSYPGADTIQFDPSLAGGTLQLDSALTITESLTITGLGSSQLSIEASTSTPLVTFVPDTAGQTFALSGLSFVGDTAKVGVGVYSSSGLGFGAASIDLTDLAFSQMVAGAGAAVSISAAGSVAILDSSFSDNEATSGDGGAVAISNSGPVTVTGSTFLSNRTATDGGALAVLNSESLDVSASTFGSLDGGENLAAGLGGAIIAAGLATSATIVGSTFLGNDAGGAGGAIYTNETPGVTIEGSSLIQNTALQGGGAYVQDSSAEVVLYQSEFIENEAISSGGGFYLEGTAPDALRVTFSLFDGNLGDGPGGGMFVEGSSAIEAFGSTFRANSGATGGGVFVAFSYGPTTVESSTFTGNSGDIGYAIGIGELYDRFTLRNSTVDEVGEAGDYALYVTDVDEGGEVLLQNSTVVGPGGVWVDHVLNGPLSITNTIIDSLGFPSVLLPEETVAEAAYSLFSQTDDGLITDLGGSLFGVTDLGLLPLADNGGPTFTRLLTSGSPARDAGDPAFAFGLEFDQRGPGYPRVQSGRLDIGAIELPAVLPATGGSVPLWMPIAGGGVLLLGAAAVAFTIVSRRRLREPADEAAPRA